MAPLPYPLPVSILEPGDNDPEARLMGRLTAGTAFAKAKGYAGMVICLRPADYALYEHANAFLPVGKSLASMTCDGAHVEPLREGVSYFQGRGQDGQLVVFPVMTDAQYVEAMTLRPGMYVMRAGDPTPCELRADPRRPGVLAVGLHSYDTKGRPHKPTSPAIFYAWDKDAMEDKAERGELTQMELAFFGAVMRRQLETAWTESRSAVRQ